ncbi:hypothetical protein PPYR_04290 [Photinus pyralis]|uniref:Uncharacterized protein n=1 Tax=Photinus pyralis TaxID=7054 RepID=A0A5N4AXN7_PHOPY|nr:hypothetical protein PPYR_04290 [Photinus pyralis]
MVCKETSRVFSPSSLWSLYSMLKATILIKKNIDISRFPKLIAFIKRQNDGYKPKKSKLLTREEMDRFLKEAPNDKYLLSKTEVILTLWNCAENICHLGSRTRIMTDSLFITKIMSALSNRLEKIRVRLMQIVAPAQKLPLKKRKW